MSFKKQAITLENAMSIKPLNSPKNWEIFNLPKQVKYASTTIEADGEDLGGFDLKVATTEHPDHLYVKIFAIRQDEVNDNGDSFSSSELEKGAESFIGVPLFTNHQNDDVEKARGTCIHSWYDKEKGGIFIIGKVDKVAYPKLARSIEEGYVRGTSMGTQVDHSLCSVCHNYSKIADDYCDHVLNRKNRKFSGKIGCAYHDNKDIPDDEECPLCGSVRNKRTKLAHTGQQIFEHNYGLKFIENSFVVNPACHDCGVSCVLHIPEIQTKVASLSNIVGNLIKSSSNENFAEENKDIIDKFGGVQELESLKNSMSEMEMVIKSMLEQKEQVSMEYVSDITKAMSDVQGIMDELTEMGYGALPSPMIKENNVEPGMIPPEQIAPVAPVNPAPVASPSMTSETSEMEGVGRVTKPKFSSNNENKIKDFLQQIQKLGNKTHALIESASKLGDTDININDNSKSTGADMSNENTKVAAGPESTNTITEKQIDQNTDAIRPRQGETYESITESDQQIGGTEEQNDTTSESPQVRKGSYDVITEGQMGLSENAIVHMNNSPEVITEKQWTDMSNLVSAKISEDYTEVITEKQIKDLLSSHKFTGPVETITEDQLANMSMTDGLTRWANKDYSVGLMKTATNAIADSIGLLQISPKELKKSASIIASDDNVKNKVAFLSLVNGLPYKKEARESLINNVSYFKKLSFTHGMTPLDAIILTVAENATVGQKAEDVVDTVVHALNNETAMNKIAGMAKERITGETEEKVVDKFAAMDEAIKVLDRPEDGLYRIKATLDEIGVPISNKVAFCDRVKKFAQMEIADEGVAATVIKIEVGEDGNVVIDVQDSSGMGEGEIEEVSPESIGDILEGPVEDMEIEEENSECGGAPAMAAAKEEISKTAQMMGGEMGGMGGASQAPGAGATMPAPPAGPDAPIESFEQEGLGMEEEGLEEDLEALPPGSICPVCSSKDVTIMSGKGKCGNCGSEMIFKVSVDITKWTGVTPGGEEEGVEEPIGEGEGFELPEETEEEMIPEAPPQGMPPMAAMVKLTPGAMEKIASSNIKIGTVSPANGTTNTMDLGDGVHVCLATGTKYKVTYKTSSKADEVWGQWEWLAKTASVDCPSCNRAKEKFIKSLASIDITEADFDKMDLQNKVKTIYKLKNANSLSLIKTANKDGSVIGDYKLAYGTYGKTFPIETCIEKLARRYGENALALSGPCEGKPLADCVCQQLKSADVYTDGIAIKVAESWKSTSGDEDCVTDQIRSGYKLRDAAAICSALKIAVAMPDDLFTEELGEEDPMGNDLGNDMGDDLGNDVVEDIDPFESDDAGTITIELPAEVAEQVADAVDTALGGEPGGEMGLEEGIDDVVPGIEEDGLGEDIVEDIPGDGMGEEIGIEDETKDMGMGMQEGNGMEEGIGMQDETKNIGIGIEESPCDIGEEIGGEEGLGEIGIGNEEGIGEGIGEEEGLGGGKVEVRVNGEKIAESEEEIKESLLMNNSINQVGNINMDLSGVIDILNKQAGEIQQEKAQDSGDIGSYTGGEGAGKLGHEDETIPEAVKPSVPRNNATMGQEESDANPQDKPQPTIPSDKAQMGHEELEGGDSRYTGGDKGQGKTETASVDDDLMRMKGFGTSQDSLQRMADKIVEAKDKKLEAPAPVADDKDIKPISDGKTMGNEEKLDLDTPTNVKGNGDESMIGHEKETLESRPDSPKDHPSIPADNATMGEEENEPEKQTKDKGTVIADSNVESEAYRVAMRMHDQGIIKDHNEVQAKVNELKTYKVSTIRDIEKSMFDNRKGLDTVADGLSQAVVINEASNNRDGKEELSTKLASLFSLTDQNNFADNDSETQLRKTYRK
jgi:hypothetical protein